jgi:FAD/FMN-containing dehydrogenase/Fe-S oxidoreductase
VNDASPSSAFERTLRSELRGEVHFDAASRGRYATDASIYQIMPIGVACPRDDQDLELALSIARSHQIPILARGAGSSQCGQTIGEALILDVSRHLNKSIELDLDARLVTVEPGMVLDRLNAELKPHGLFYPVDVSTSAQATLGGMAGNNSCGSRSLQYGNMVHNVEAIDAFMADGHAIHFAPGAPAGRREEELEAAFRSLAHKHSGEIASSVPKMLRRVGGYNIDLLECQSPKPYRDDGLLNMAQLLIGSEGTLAFTRRLTLKLAELPRKRVLGVVNFASLHEAMSHTAAIVNLGPSAVELVDRTIIDLALGNPAFAPVVAAVLRNQPGALLLVEFATTQSEPLHLKLDELADLLNARFSENRLVRLETEASQKALWEVRKAGLNIMMSMHGDGKPVSFIEDCAVPLEHLAEYTEKLSEVFARHGTHGTWYAHASVGTLHVRPILDMRRDGGKKMRAIANEAAALVRAFKGAYSGEHGDGLCRGEWIGWQFGPALCSAFRDIKQLFDPEHRFAPGKMLDAPPMDDASLFRYKPGHRVIELIPKLDWASFDVTRDPVSGVEGPPGSGRDASHGLAMAVDMCNNNGHCRKFDAGTMCPSYRVTQDEKHVTRGRANTLRLALSGQLGPDGLASEDVKQALDLCVSCKGCKRECPTGVDMARFKIEARAASASRHGTPLRERVIAALPHSMPKLTRHAWLAGLVNQLVAKTGFAAAMLGFSSKRPLPTLQHAFLSDSLNRDGFAAPASVVLWVDTFNNHFDPNILRAAVDVLAACGEQVVIAGPPEQRPLCCGRTYLAAGDIDAARGEARRSLEALLPLVQGGAVVVGVEPSCLLTLRDEWLTLGLGDGANQIAEASFLFEEYLAKDHVASRLAEGLGGLAETILVHGHCHQKAFDAFAPMLKVLRLIPELEVRPIESSCCGMAGSFGLEAEHYDVSIAMAELSLAPAIRALPGARVIADGTSCRAQVAHTTGRPVLHCAELLAESLRKGRGSVSHE